MVRVELMLSPDEAFDQPDSRYLLLRDPRLYVAEFTHLLHPLLLLQPVKAKCILGGGIGEDHVWVIEHVQAIQRQRVDFQIVQRELGVHIKADICGQRARQVLGQAGWRLSTHCGKTTRKKNIEKIKYYSSR